jgi:thiol-disulfide isomerase/thioredoxin
MGTSVRTVAAAVLLVALAGCSQASGQTVAGQGYISGKGTVTAFGAAERDQPVGFRGTTLDGGTFDVRDHRGEVVVVNVWGSWCPPCIAEAPDLQEVWSEVEDDGVQFVGIDFRDNTAAAKAHERRFGVTYPSIEDEAGRTLLSLRGTLSPSAIPSTLVLDRRGRVAARVLGQVPASTLRALVSDTLAEGGGP